VVKQIIYFGTEGVIFWPHVTFLLFTFIHNRNNNNHLNFYKKLEFEFFTNIEKCQHF
jgi:hypothetical protein